MMNLKMKKKKNTPKKHVISFGIRCDWMTWDFFHDTHLVACGLTIYA